MTDSKHTAEPWERMFPNDSDGYDSVADSHGNGIFQGEYYEPTCSPADARRIVACVNACAGIPTEFLEGSTKQSDDWFRLRYLKAAVEVEMRHRA